MPASLARTRKHTRCSARSICACVFVLCGVWGVGCGVCRRLCPLAARAYCEQLGRLSPTAQQQQLLPLHVYYTKCLRVVTREDIEALDVAELGRRLLALGAAVSTASKPSLVTSLLVCVPNAVGCLPAGRFPWLCQPRHRAARAAKPATLCPDRRTSTPGLTAAHNIDQHRPNALLQAHAAASPVQHGAQPLALLHRRLQPVR